MWFRNVIRPLIWRDSGIPGLYRQNTVLLFVNRKASPTLDFLRSEASKIPIPLHRAHPDLLRWQAGELARRQEELEQKSADFLQATVRTAELQTDLTAQGDFNGRVLSEVWGLMNKMRSERETERSRIQVLESDRNALVREVESLQAALSSAERDRADLRSSLVANDGSVARLPRAAAADMEPLNKLDKAMKICLVCNEISGACRNGGRGTATSHLALFCSSQNGHCVTLFFSHSAPLDPMSPWASDHSGCEHHHLSTSIVSPAHTNPSWMSGSPWKSTSSFNTRILTSSCFKSGGPWGMPAWWQSQLGLPSLIPRLP